MKPFYCFLFLLGCYSIAWAQPSNDDCATPIVLPFTNNWCSTVGAYSNVGATPSTYAAPACFTGGTGSDVWFSFVATGTDVNITVIGNEHPVSGGTLNQPQLVLYRGTCGGTLHELRCAQANTGVHIVDLYRGSLVIGQTYLIRVQGRNNRQGTFQICAQNYNAPATPSSDCPTGAVLCDKSSFTVQRVVGAGNDPDEMQQSCLGGSGGNSESNSTWFQWTCDQSGSFTFSLTPTNRVDDLDFVLYELPNGIGNCSGKILRRCMAAGEQVALYPSPCHGPTGLRFSSSDNTEGPGCDNGQDNWLSAINLVSGRSYALVVNNYTSTGNGFQIEFGGTATFQGPDVDFSVQALQASNCAGGAWSFTDNTTSATGTVTQWLWSFGTGASPTSANTRGPHNVTYSTPGTKSIVLTAITDQGCRLSKVITLDVDPCCDADNALQLTDVITDETCLGDQDGSIALTAATTRLTPYQYQWYTGATTNALSNLSAGTYQVTISNGICDTIIDYQVQGPPPWQLQDSITRPTCDGGTDGAIELLAVNGARGAPYTYNWQNTGFGMQTSLRNLSNGFYTLTIQDGTGCDTTINYTVQELPLELGAGSIGTDPTCFGFSNGSIRVVVANGLPPYTFTWNDGATGPLRTNLPTGNYQLDTIWDANRCRNWAPFVFNLGQPDSLDISLDSNIVTCTGQPDGALFATVSGGTLPYQYLWSTGSQDSMALNLSGGVYSLRVTDSLGCTKTIYDTLSEPLLLTLDYRVQDALCAGSTTGAILFSGRGGRPFPNGTYLYGMEPNVYSSKDSFVVAAGTDYIGYVEDSEGCRSQIGGIVVQEPDVLTVDLGSDRTARLGEWLELIPALSFFDYHRYQWTAQEGQLSCDTCRLTNIRPLSDDTWVRLQITNPNGCVAYDSLRIEVIKDRDFFVPNAFSPNGDGNNDLLDVYTSENVHAIRRFAIYDRWGECVFNKTAIPQRWRNFGWDGTFLGKRMPSGVYAYLVEIEFLDGVVQVFSGDVSLLR